MHPVISTIGQDRSSLAVDIVFCFVMQKSGTSGGIINEYRSRNIDDVKYLEEVYFKKSRPK